MKISYVAWNLGGLALPLCVAAITIPHLISTLGQERFGLLALAWGLIGYAGAMDLGLGRALTQMVARLIGEGKNSAIADTMTTAGSITLITGIVGGALISILSISNTSKWMQTNNISQEEINLTILIISAAIPTQAISATYRGLNEAFLNFRGINLLRASLGILNFAGPYATSHFTTALPWLISTLVVSRFLAFIAYRQLAFKCLQQNSVTPIRGKYSQKIAKDLLSFGGWVTVSSIVSPILVQADRFVIASTISAAAVAAYVLPYEVATQNLIFVTAITAVVYPSLSRLIQDKSKEWKSYFYEWLTKTTLIMSIICGGAALIIPWLLPLWIKNNLQPESVRIGQILCLGVFFNSIGSIFYALLHAQGRAKTTAILHLIELPLFIMALFALINQMGVVGAAWAWVLRMLFDTVALGWQARRTPISNT